MRTLTLLSLLLPLALPAQTIITKLGENGWNAYSDYNSDLKHTTFDFHNMAGTTDGALTITTSGVADIASKGISGTSLSSFVGATYRWEGTSKWSVSLKLDVSSPTEGRKTLVYNPGLAPTDWTTTTVDANSNSYWRLTPGTGSLKFSEWLGILGPSATINAIELGLGSSSSGEKSAGSIDWLNYSVRSSNGAVTTTTVDFAAPIPEPATTAALVAIGGLGVALVARRRKQRQ
jgi:hypothetical protein